MIDPASETVTVQIFAAGLGTVILFLVVIFLQLILIYDLLRDRLPKPGEKGEH
jgi:hypothetical protein